MGNRNTQCPHLSGFAGVAQLAEQLICNQQVAGSSPFTSSIITNHLVGFPSGQREQTVNLPSQTSMVRIHPPPPFAEMAELADALDSGSSEHYAHAGSSPVFRTKPSVHKRTRFFLCQYVVMNIRTTSEQSTLCFDVFYAFGRKRRHPPAPLPLLTQPPLLSRWAPVWFSFTDA